MNNQRLARKIWYADNSLRHAHMHYHGNSTEIWGDIRHIYLIKDMDLSINPSHE